MLSWIGYWPIIIVCWALARVARGRFTLRSFRTASPVEAAVLLSVVFLCSTVTASAKLSSRFGRAIGLDGGDDVWSVTGNNYEFTERLDSPVPPGAAIEIVNRYGDVEIRREAGSRLTLTARKTVRASRVEEARSMNEKFSFRIEPLPGGARMRSSLDGASRFPERERYRSRLIVVAPSDASLKVENRGGAVYRVD